MAIMTLLEYKKQVTDPTQAFVISEFLESRLLQVLPFMDVQGGGLFYSTVESLPGIGFRGINEDFNDSAGVINPESEALKLFGGDMSVDVALVDRYGQDARSAHIQLKLEAARLRFEKTFIKGDSSINPREFDGLQRRITGRQLVANGADDTGNPLSINSLDKAIDQVKAGTGRKIMFLNDTIKRRIEQYFRSTGNGGIIRVMQNELGQEVEVYRGCELVVLEEDDEANPILPFTETSPDGSSSTDNCSIYVARFGPMLTTGIQGPSNGINGIYAEDFGRIQEKPKFLTRVHWDCGLAVMNGRSVARLAGIQDAPATA